MTCSRYLGEAKYYDDNLITALGNNSFTKAINFFHGGTYTDTMVMYRSVHRKVFAELQLDTNQSFRIPEWLFQTKICLMPLLSIRAARKNIRTTEIPGDEPARIGGVRKMKIVRWGMAYYFQIIFEMFYRFEQRT